MRHFFEEINAAPMMALNIRATSGDARKLVYELAITLLAQEQRKRQRRAADQRAFELAIELIIGDLFANYKEDAGRAIRFTSSEQTDALRKQVEQINTYLISHELSGGLFAGYIRRFSEGDHPEFKWDRGGRLYAVGGESYQLMKKPERLQMRINHCPVAEIDISSSYLTMLHALLDAPLPASNDLYEVDGLPRDIVKAFVTATIGNNKFHTRWPAKLSQELKKQGFDLSRMPMRFVQAKVCEALPVLATWEQQPISWSRLMFMESEQMLATMDELREEHDVPSYSVHDSIIIPESKVDFAAHILKMKFEGHFGIQYRLKAHLSDGQLLAF